MLGFRGLGFRAVLNTRNNSIKGAFCAKRSVVRLCSTASAAGVKVTSGRAQGFDCRNRDPGITEALHP